MEKKLKKHLLPLVACIIGSLILASCAADLDEYLQNKEKEMIELQKADELLRADLSQMLLDLKADVLPRITEVQNRLSGKIEADGNDLLAAITDSAVNQTARISARATEVKTYIDNNMNEAKTSIENRFVQLEAARNTLNEQLLKAINDNDAALQADITERLNAINLLENTTNNVKSELEGLETSLVEMEGLATRISGMQQTAENIRERYGEYMRLIDSMLAAIEKHINEEVLPTYSADIMIRLKSWTNTAKTQVENSEIILAETHDKFNEAERLYSDIVNIMSDFEVYIEEMMAGIDDAMDYADEVNSLVDEITSLASDISDIETDISYASSEGESLASYFSTLGGLIDEARIAAAARESEYSTMYDIFDLACQDAGEAMSDYDEISDKL